MYEAINCAQNGFNTLKVKGAKRSRFQTGQSTKGWKFYYSNGIEGQLSSTYIKYENLALYVASYVVIWYLATGLTTRECEHHNNNTLDQQNY